MNRRGHGEGSIIPQGCRRVHGTFEDGLDRYVFTTKNGSGVLHDHSRGCFSQGEAEAAEVAMRVAGGRCAACGEATGKLS